MEAMLAVVVGGLVAASVYLMLQRGLAQLIIGLSILTNAANLLIFTVGGLTRGQRPLIAEDATRPPPVFADPLPQALILTAIVIGFGVLAFALTLAFRTYGAVGSDDVDALTATDALDGVSRVDEEAPAAAWPRAGF